MNEIQFLKLRIEETEKAIFEAQSISFLEELTEHNKKILEGLKEAVLILEGKKDPSFKGLAVDTLLVEMLDAENANKYAAIQGFYNPENKERIISILNKITNG